MTFRSRVGSRNRVAPRAGPLHIEWRRRATAATAPSQRVSTAAAAAGTAWSRFADSHKRSPLDLPQGDLSCGARHPRARAVAAGAACPIRRIARRAASTAIALGAALFVDPRLSRMHAMPCSTLSLAGARLHRPPSRPWRGIATGDRNHAGALRRRRPALVYGRQDGANDNLWAQEPAADRHDPREMGGGVPRLSALIARTMRCVSPLRKRTIRDAARRERRSRRSRRRQGDLPPISRRAGVRAHAIRRLSRRARPRRRRDAAALFRPTHAAASRSLSGKARCEDDATTRGRASPMARIPRRREKLPFIPRRGAHASTAAAYDGIKRLRASRHAASSAAGATIPRGTASTRRVSLEHCAASAEFRVPSLQRRRARTRHTCTTAARERAPGRGQALFRARREAACTADGQAITPAAAANGRRRLPGLVAYFHESLLARTAHRADPPPVRLKPDYAGVRAALSLADRLQPTGRVSGRTCG